MSKMPKSSKEVVKVEETKTTDIIEVKQNSLETNTDEKAVETKPKKFSFKEAFTDKNLKKFGLWFLNSFIWLAILLFIGDMLTKHFAEVYLKGGKSIEVIPHLLSFTLTYNTGAAWGAGGDAMWSRILLCVISWVAMIGIIYALIRYYKKLNNWYKAAIMMVLAGDVGNLIDRTFFFNRGVIDFLDVRAFIPGFGIFNFADSCLVVGIIFLMILFIIDMFKESKDNKKKAAAAEAKIQSEKQPANTEKIENSTNVEDENKNERDK